MKIPVILSICLLLGLGSLAQDAKKPAKDTPPVKSVPPSPHPALHPASPPTTQSRPATGAPAAGHTTAPSYPRAVFHTDSLTARPSPYHVKKDGTPDKRYKANPIGGENGGTIPTPKPVKSDIGGEGGGTIPSKPKDTTKHH